MTVTVVNKYKDKLIEPYYYVGRGSPVGNPFPRNKTNTRDEVCDKYEIWFKEQLLNKENIPFHSYLNAMYKDAIKKDIQLGCFCKQPNKEVRCHGDTIKKYLDLKLKGK